MALLKVPPLIQKAEGRDFMRDGISHNERRIVLIGKTGSGKSATGNTILGISDAFESKPSGESITKSCQKREAERFGKKLLVVDTPGLCDTSMSVARTNEEIGKCIGITSPGPHAIVLVVQINRFTEEEQKTVDLFVERFGEGMYPHLIVLFTRKDDLVRSNMSIQKYVMGIKKLASIFQRCQDRYIAFDNFSPDKDKDVRSLLEMIEVIVKKNGGKCYTNQMLIEAENAMKRRMDAIREEIRKQKEQEIKHISDQIAKSYEDKLRIQKEQKAKQQKEIDTLITLRQIEAKKQKDEMRILKKQNEERENQRQREAEKKMEKLVEDRRKAEYREKQLEIEMQEEMYRKEREIEEKHKRELEEDKLRNQARNEVQKRGFWGLVWDFFTLKWLRK